MVYVGGVRKGAFFIAFGKGIRDNLDQNGFLEIFGTNILNNSFSMPANKKTGPAKVPSLYQTVFEIREQPYFQLLTSR